MNKRQLAYLEKAHSYALSKEGKCLSDSYDTIKIPLQWKCKEGHTWERNYEKTVNRGIWCTACFNAERERLVSEAIKSPEIPRGKSPEILHYSDVIYYPYAIIEQQYKNIML
jgi:hypothetical protein